MSEFTLTKGDDGVAVITWDVPDKSMNVMRFDGLRELEAARAELAELYGSTAYRIGRRLGLAPNRG